MKIVLAKAHCDDRGTVEGAKWCERVRGWKVGRIEAGLSRHAIFLP